MRWRNEALPLLAHQHAFYGGNYPSIVIDGQILPKDEATAVSAAITRYGDALKDGEMGPIERSVLLAAR